MKKQLPAWLALALIALAAGLLLGLTNALTQSKIEEQTRLAADAARQAVLPEATEFVQLEAAEGAPVDNCFMGERNGTPVGYTAQATQRGYGGDIEVTVGLGLDGTITGIYVGGPNFAETAGLGAKTKDTAFTSQYQNKAAPVTLGEDVDAVTAATISSNAVNSAVNRAAQYIMEACLGTTLLEVEPLPISGATAHE